jgi:hypothetical protein
MAKAPFLHFGVFRPFADGACAIHTAKEEDAMTAANYSLLAAVIFAVVAILQMARAVMRLPVTIGQMSVPIWASWVACGVAIILAWLGYAGSQL